jgi:hypothetical protein
MLTPKMEAAGCTKILVMLPTNLQSFTYWKAAIVRTIHPKKLFSLVKWHGFVITLGYPSGIDSVCLI